MITKSVSWKLPAYTLLLSLFLIIFFVFFWPKTNLAKNIYYQENYPFFALPRGFQEEIIYRSQGREADGFSLLHYKDKKVENWSPGDMDPSVQTLTSQQFIEELRETPFLRDHMKEIEALVLPSINKDSRANFYKYEKDGNIYFLYVPSKTNVFYFLYSTM